MCAILGHAGRSLGHYIGERNHPDHRERQFVIGSPHR
jgi:hypothetical protein